MQTLSEIRELLASRGLRPKHRLGQNFLHDKNQLSKLIAAAKINQDDLILEVGPGTGTLTEALLEAGAEVIACELDEGLAELLVDRLGDRLRLIRGDCLVKQRQLNPSIVEAVDGRRFKLVANLPYQAASPLISTLLIDHPGCIGQFATIQREVAERLTATPSTKAYGSLSVIVQAFAEVESIGTLSPSCFWPAPEVTSAMVTIRPISTSPLSGEYRREFARFVTNLFTKRRKQLGTIFGRQRSDWPVGVTPQQRPEALTPQQCITMWQVNQPVQ